MQETQGLPAVQAMLATARKVLGYDLLQVCLEGPKERLDSTEVAQPALFVAGLAAIEKLRASNPTVVTSCTAAAGLSLGEYCALVFADALSFEDGLRVRCIVRIVAAMALRPPYSLPGRMICYVVPAA